MNKDLEHHKRKQAEFKAALEEMAGLGFKIIDCHALHDESGYLEWWVSESEVYLIYVSFDNHHNLKQMSAYKLTNTIEVEKKGTPDTNDERHAVSVHNHSAIYALIRDLIGKAKE